MALTQTNHRIGASELTEATHGWLADANRTGYRRPGPDGEFLLRVGVQADAAGRTNLSLQLQYRILRPRDPNVPVGSWVGVPATATTEACEGVGTVAFANNDDCTQRLVGGTGTFTATNRGCSTNGTCGGAANDIVADGCTECAFALRIINANTNLGDVLEFRLVEVGGVELDSYPAGFPTVYVTREVLTTGAREAVATPTTTFSANRINGAVVGYFGVLTAAEIADPALSIVMRVMGTTDPASEVYDVPLYGPDTWTGGLIGKGGTPIAPGLLYSANVPNGVRKVRATFAPSRALTYGVEGTIIEGVANASRG